MISLKHLNQRIALQSFARTVSNTFKHNPGVNKRKKIVKPSEDDVELDQFDLETLESDFMQVHRSYNEHIKETEKLKEKEKYWIIKQKYFKETYPNFLTWHDKEQIRYLHNKDPEEWSIEALSDGFPATPSVIKKILKGNYRKTDIKRIESHDKIVEKNWEEFKGGKMQNLPPEVREHLKKFTDRKLNFKPFEIPENERKIVENIENPPGEFSEIILSYQKLKNKNKIEEKNNIKIEGGKIKNNNYNNKDKIVTFAELKSSIENKFIAGKEITEDEKLILKHKENKLEETEKPKESISDIMEIQKNKTEVAVFTKTRKDYSHLIYPENIKIPKDLYEEGKTYQLNDCFYHSDGSFLYRVPGYFK